MKKILLLALVATAFTSILKAQPQVTPTIDKTAPVMKFETDSMNFGTITQGTIVEKDYVFKNTGKTPLVITSASGSCHCTVPHFPTEPIQPGKKGTIHVVFDSNGKMGAQDKTATIVSNNRDGAVILHLRGTVIVPPTPPAVPDQQKPAVPAGGGN